MVISELTRRGRIDEFDRRSAARVGGEHTDARLLSESEHTMISPSILLADEPEPEVRWGRIRLQKGTMKERRSTKLKLLWQRIAHAEA